MYRFSPGPRPTQICIEPWLNVAGTANPIMPPMNMPATDPEPGVATLCAIIGIEPGSSSARAR